MVDIEVWVVEDLYELVNCVDVGGEVWFEGVELVVVYIVMIDVVSDCFGCYDVIV